MPRIALVLLVFALASCDAVSVGEAQRLFELEALSPPSGITSTDAQGRVVSRDSDDWRVSPLYQTSFVFTFVPYPNPASATQSIQVAGTYSGQGAGLYPYRIDSQGNLDPIVATSGNREGAAPLFSFPAGQLGEVGLTRIVLLDQSGRFVSYGDIQIIP